jgi:hypothetical protein
MYRISVLTIYVITCSRVQQICIDNDPRSYMQRGQPALRTVLEWRHGTTMTRWRYAVGGGSLNGHSTLRGVTLDVWCRETRWFPRAPKQKPFYISMHSAAASALKLNQQQQMSAFRNVTSHYLLMPCGLTQAYWTKQQAADFASSFSVRPRR